MHSRNSPGRIDPSSAEQGLIKAGVDRTHETKTPVATGSPTERDKSTEALRASELSYRRLFEAAKDGILILETDTGKISDVNPFLMEMLGLSRAELVGTPVWELGPAADIPANKTRFEQLQKQGYIRYEDMPLEAKDGRKLAVEFVSNVYQAGDSNVIQCNVRDISERKQTAEEIRLRNEELEKRVSERTAELQSANELLETFSYSVSHDLHAPLRQVLAYLKILEEEAGPTHSETSQLQMTKIFKTVTRMGNLIDELLAFSRIGKSDMQKTEVDLDALVQATVSDFQADLKERRIIWEIHPLPKVRGDAALLRLAFVNLISNAVKFTGKCAEGKIEIGCVPNNDGESVIFIRDNGAGFDPHYAEKLFGVFQRLHSQEEFEGTGIGLANVRRIIHRHGGRIWAESAVDGGATFYFSIPRGKSALGCS